MTLQQFHALKIWHSRQGRRHPVERAVWDAVLTLWMLGWAGWPAAYLLHLEWAAIACFGALFVPGAYVALRRRLHGRRVLRCDWMGVLR